MISISCGNNVRQQFVVFVIVCVLIAACGGKSEGSPHAANVPSDTASRPTPAERSAPTSSSGSADSLATDSWDEDTLEVSKLDDSHSATLSLKAQNTFVAWPNNEVKAALILRCREHKVQAYVVTNTSPQPELGSYQTYTARVRYDKRPARSVTVEESTDSKALFFSEPIGVIENLLATDTFLFAFTPFNSNLATIEFDTRGLVRHVGAIKRTCPRTRIAMPPTPAEREAASRAEAARTAARVAAFNEEHLKYGPWVHDASNNTIMYWSTKCKGDAYRAAAPVYFSSKEKAEAHGFVEEQCPDTT